MFAGKIYGLSKYESVKLLFGMGRLNFKHMLALSSLLGGMNTMQHLDIVSQSGTYGCTD